MQQLLKAPTLLVLAAAQMDNLKLMIYKCHCYIHTYSSLLHVRMCMCVTIIIINTCYSMKLSFMYDDYCIAIYI